MIAAMTAESIASDELSRHNARDLVILAYVGGAWSKPRGTGPWVSLLQAEKIGDQLILIRA